MSGGVSTERLAILVSVGAIVIVQFLLSIIVL